MMPRHKYVISQWQLEKRVTFDRLLDRIEWLLGLQSDDIRRKKIKGSEILAIEDAMAQCSDAILRKAEEDDEIDVLDEIDGRPQILQDWFDEYGFEPVSDPPDPPDTGANWKICPTCGNPAYFRITKLNYRCTKGHIIERPKMPGDDFHNQ